MLVLAFDASATAASVAIVRDGRIIAENYLNCGLTHSQTLLPLADNALKCAGVSIDEVEAFAVSDGPGSFTGIRIGVSCVKGMAFASKKKVYGVSTLEAMAWQCADEEHVICPVMDARRDQFYSALFTYSSGKVLRLKDDSALSAAELKEEIIKSGREVVLIGDGADKAYDMLKSSCPIKKIPEFMKYQRASGVAFAALNMYNEGEAGIDSLLLRPSYLRPSQAERERSKKTEGML